MCEEIVIPAPDCWERLLHWPSSRKKGSMFWELENGLGRNIACELGWLAGSVLSLFFPRKCALCGKPLPYGMMHLCGDCLWEMPFAFIKTPPQSAQQCFWGRVQVNQVWPLFVYQGRYKELVHNIKYCNDVSLGLYLGEMLGRRIFNSMALNASFSCGAGCTQDSTDLPAACQSASCPSTSTQVNLHSAGAMECATSVNRFIDFVIPVPLHWRRRLKRGYNQSGVIARGICRGYNLAAEDKASEYNSTVRDCERGEKSLCGRIIIPECKVLSQVLYRKSATRTQTRKDRAERWLNVRDAFGARATEKNRRLLEGKHVLLVDDVLTTGATLDACATVLLAHFNCSISIATLGYVQ